jgi:hypothetical protein
MSDKWIFLCEEKNTTKDSLPNPMWSVASPIHHHLEQIVEGRSVQTTGFKRIIVRNSLLEFLPIQAANN